MFPHFAAMAYLYLLDFFDKRWMTLLCNVIIGIREAAFETLVV